MGDLHASLVAALAELTTVETARTAKIPTKNGGEFSYKYADIADVVKVTRPVLAAQGIVALTPIVAHGTGLGCLVRLVHSSGETMDLGPFPFEPGRDAQTTGSAVTYHRRYALVAALGIAAGDDDDGASAAHARSEPRHEGFTEADAKNLLIQLVGSKEWRGAWDFGSADGWGSYSEDAVRELAEKWRGREM